MSVGDAGLIITAVALLLCLRCRRTHPPFLNGGETTEERKNRRIMRELEQWRNGK